MLPSVSNPGWFLMYNGLAGLADLELAVFRSSDARIIMAMLVKSVFAFDERWRLPVGTADDRE
jgi:hypothetical protein